MDHPAIIETITQTVREAPGVAALFLSGSYATGLEDAYSDIDFVLVTEDGASDAMAQLWQDAVSQIGEIVLWWDRSTRPMLINAITANWTRIDVVILKPDQMGYQTKVQLKPLFDPGGIYGTLKPGSATTQMSDARLAHQIEEFIRILGLLHLAAGREEYINGVLGVFHLRNILTELLIEETGAPHRGGVLHLNRLITAEQKELLTALSPPVAEREAMIAGHLAYAAAFLPRARKMAAARGLAWPDRFEEVTWAKLKDTLGVARPYEPLT